MRRLLPLAAALAIWLAPAAAKHGNGKGHGKGKDGGATVVVFTATDRRVIQEFCHSGSGLPPGLAKRNGDLPQGLEKQLRRNGRLPPGLEKKVVWFPPELEGRLPPPPPGYRRGFIGGHAVLVDPGKGLLLDFFAAF